MPTKAETFCNRRVDTMTLGEASLYRNALWAFEHAKTVDGKSNAEALKVRDKIINEGLTDVEADDAD